MNIFQKYTLRALKKNRVRTLVTIIGIIISMAMFTAVIESAYSGLQFLRRSEEASSGKFHGYYSGMSRADAEAMSEQDGVEYVSVLQNVGWAVADVTNTYKPYIMIESADDNISELVSVHMIDGRMPQNANEIAIPAHLINYAASEIKLGDTLTLSVGQRIDDDGNVLAPNDPLLYTFRSEEEKENGEVTGSDKENEKDGEQEDDIGSSAESAEVVSSVSDNGIVLLETIKNTKEITYTIVGIFERLDYTIEYYDAPGFTALTCGGGTGECRAFFTLNNPAGFNKYVVEHPQNGKLRSHSDLLMYYGSIANHNLGRVVIGMVAVLIALIFVGSVSLIYNSFSISVGERTRQFGILKSIGATGRQIRGSVIFEALVLCAVGIPVGILAGCVGIGITLWCLRDQFGFLGASAVGEYAVEMRLVITPLGLLIAAVIGVITALVSAWIPAKRAMKLSPIDAIRQSADIKLSRRDVRSSPLARRIFGFEGMMAAKNFARNRKRYRSTVISIFLSVTLFISASSFCSYMTDAVGEISSDSGVDIGYTHWEYSGTRKNIPSDEMYEMMRSVEGVEKSSAYKYLYFDYELATDDADPSLIKDADRFNAEVQGDKIALSGAAVFLDDESFREFCSENKLNADDFYNASAPAAILCGDLKVKCYDNGSSRLYTTNVIKSSSLPLSVYTEAYEEIDGYDMEYYLTDDDTGKMLYYYYETSYVKEVRENGGRLDIERARVLAEEEALAKYEVKIAAATSKRPLVSDIAGEMCFVYPLSMYEEVSRSTFKLNSISREHTVFTFTADDHSSVAAKMRTILLSNGIEDAYLNDFSESYESDRMLVKVINVFAIGFIVLISMIAMVNMFNTISTNLLLRRREFAMLRSVGMTSGGFNKMMNYECIKYGAKGLLWGLPVSLALTFLIYCIVTEAYTAEFYVPWYSVAVAVGSVFAVVFAAMLYTMRMIRGDNTIDALKNENI